MGTSLSLRGRTSHGDPLPVIEAVLGDAAGVLVPRIEHLVSDAGQPLLVVHLHPAAEPVRVTELGAGRLEFEALTGTAGPVYLAFVAERFHALAAQLPLVWEHVEDESGHFESGDLVALENATLRWLSATAMEVLSLHARGYRGLQLSLPEGTVFEHDGVVATPMGPRDKAWLESVARTPRSGIDVFPWWTPGLGASTLRGLSLSTLWLDLRWRKPLIEAERALLATVLGWLERGHDLDPQLAWPWREWSELFEILGEESLRATRAHLRATAGGLAMPIGFRRRPVRVTLSGGWSLRVPGELAERWEDPSTWVGWDGGRSIWFSSLEVASSHSSEDTLEALPPLEGQGELMGLERDDVRAIARFDAGEEDGRILVTLRAHAAMGAHAAVGTFVLEHEKDRDWALETWASAAHLDEPRRARD